MSNKINGWDDVDPYDNHADIRQNFQPKTQATGQPVPMNQSTAGFLANSQLDEIIDEQDEAEEQIQVQSGVLHEAVKRIEQANLYQSLLAHELFAPNSARPEIVHKVQSEIKEFILERLELLLGMKIASEKSKPVEVILPFDEEQVSALSALANRALRRDTPQVAMPRPIPPVPSYQPMIQPMIDTTKTTAPALGPQSVQTAAPVQKATKPAAKKATKQAPPAFNPEHGRVNKGQAVNPNTPPLPMPTQQYVDSMNAMAAQKAMGNAGLADVLKKAVGESLK